MIKSQITFKQLEAFAFVVDTGTFRAAAATLGTTQPNISARIASLEDTLGVRLLHRDAGSVRLTAKGTALLAKARDVLWAAESLLEDAGRQDLMDERLRLGVTELVACTWLQPFLRRVRQAYPKLRVELQVDLSVRIEEGLMDGTLDLAIQNLPFKTEVSGTKELGVEPYIWLANPEQAGELGTSPRMEQVFARPVMTHAKHTQAGSALHDMAQTRGLGTHQIVHSSALSACVPMACEGFGAALLPEALVKDALASGALRTLTCDWLPKPLSFFARYHADRVPRFVTKIADLASEVSAGEDKQNLSPPEI